MTQAEFEREVAQTTGESCAKIRRFGFNLLVLPEREPRATDWDEPPRPFRRRRQRVVA